MTVSRRDFLKAAATAAVAGALPLERAEAAKNRIWFGYASITWGNNELLAIDEISAEGFPGIQLRAGILSRFPNTPTALNDLLGKHKLSFVALSSGSVRIDPAIREQVLDEHVTHARWVGRAGGRFLQVTDERPIGRPVTPDDCHQLGDLLTELGRRTAEIGVPVAYHPHMGTIGETPENVARILAATDPMYVRLLLDVAHYTQGGGDPAKAIRQFRDRLAFLHLKDVQSDGAGYGYRFVELGRGRVDFPAIFTALRDIGYDGWGIVELDSVPDKKRSPSQAAFANKLYLLAHGFRVSLD
jgi:inosose dehydratase